MVKLWICLLMFTLFPFHPIPDAMVEKISLPFAKRVLSITPPVPRRKGWENDESSVFHIRFKTEEGRNEVCHLKYICGVTHPTSA